MSTHEVPGAMAFPPGDPPRDTAGAALVRPIEAWPTQGGDPVSDICSLFADSEAVAKTGERGPRAAEPRAIVIAPARVLQRVSVTPLVPSADIEELVADLFETMYRHGAVGLAAPQVGMGMRVFVADPDRGPPPPLGMSAMPVRPLVFVDPRIISSKGRRVDHEGCMSLPGRHLRVRRAAECVVEAFDVKGQPFRMETAGLLACIVQHEIDHLNGVLITSRRS